MAEVNQTYSPWRVPTTPGTVTSQPVVGTTGCPIFYPSDVGMVQQPYCAPTTSLIPAPSLPVPPACKWPTQAGEQLKLSVWVSTGSKTVTFFGSYFDTANGQKTFSQQVTGNSPTTAVTFTQPLGPGCLLSLDALATTSLSGVTVNVLGQIGKTVGGTFYPAQTVLRGQLTDQGLADLSSSVAGSAGGGGGGGCCIYDTIFFNGVETGNLALEIAVTAGENWRIESFNFVADTSATAGNRQIAVHVTAFGGYDVVLWADADYIAANEIWYYYFNSAGGQGATPSPGGTKYRSFDNPVTMWFDSTFFLNVNFNNKQSGDAITDYTVILNTKAAS